MNKINYYNKVMALILASMLATGCSAYEKQQPVESGIENDEDEFTITDSEKELINEIFGEEEHLNLGDVRTYERVVTIEDTEILDFDGNVISEFPINQELDFISEYDNGYIVINFGGESALINSSSVKVYSTNVNVPLQKVTYIEEGTPIYTTDRIKDGSFVLSYSYSEVNVYDSFGDYYLIEVNGIFGYVEKSRCNDQEASLDSETKPKLLAKN